MLTREEGSCGKHDAREERDRFNKLYDRVEQLAKKRNSLGAYILYKRLLGLVPDKDLRNRIIRRLRESKITVRPRPNFREGLSSIARYHSYWSGLIRKKEEEVIREKEKAAWQQEAAEKKAADFEEKNLEEIRFIYAI